MSDQYVAFKLDSNEYAVEILAVQEIIRWSNITRVPRAPEYIKGVINLRGAIIPIVDSHLRFELAGQEVTDDTRIIVFRYDDTIIGLTVDLVTEVLSLPQQSIEKHQSIHGAENQFISGIGKLEERLLIILDLAKVLELGVQH
ncbi:MAG: chemotaxis protein CheW [Clostridia bacterium]|jgi:purine-binding chemotaxis protein CheW|nr:chemotaxis protein CheW [Clostridia bacterium]